jgi:hypothetical protein
MGLLATASVAIDGRKGTVRLSEGGDSDHRIDATLSLPPFHDGNLIGRLALSLCEVFGSPSSRLFIKRTGHSMLIDSNWVAKILIAMGVVSFFQVFPDGYSSIRRSFVSRRLGDCRAATV